MNSSGWNQEYNLILSEIFINSDKVFHIVFNKDGSVVNFSENLPEKLMIQFLSERFATFL